MRTDRRPRAGATIAAAAFLTAGLLSAAAISAAPPQARRTYTLYVAAESDDVVEKIAFGPEGFRHIRSIPVGVWPTETEGPHGITISPDGRYWYVTVAHGNPYGILFKYDTETDTYAGDVKLGLFPATLSVSPSTGLLFAVNFNLHGDPVPSTISVVETESMTEVAQIPTGVMPHGSRMNANGSRHYSVAMMDDELREVDAYKLRTNRVLKLSQATDRPIVKPTWVTPVTPQGKVYVAGNANATIYEIDVDDWKIVRTFEGTGKGVYNLDVTPDGKILVGTYKGAKSVGIWDIEAGREMARIDTLRPLPHGVVCSPDGKLAFVSIEGIGGEPGSVEAYDLETLERVGNIDIGKQASGIGIWKVE